MKIRLINIAYGGIGFLVLLGVYLTVGWVSQRYTEFVVMRTVTIAVACQNPSEAAKLGIGCGAPAPAPAPAATPAPPDTKPPAK